MNNWIVMIVHIAAQLHLGKIHCVNFKNPVWHAHTHARTHTIHSMHNTHTHTHSHTINKYHYYCMSIYA